MIYLIGAFSKSDNSVESVSASSENDTGLLKGSLGEPTGQGIDRRMHTNTWPAASRVVIKN